MCGIFALLNNSSNSNSIDNKIIENEFLKGQKRGPEFSKLDNSFKNIILGFHRLAINGLNNASNQPLIINDVALICNGEIYNYKQLYKYIDIEPQTGSDCEVIIHLYIKYGIEKTLKILDGVFAFILYDNHSRHVYIARDPFGVRPLYYLKNINDFKNIVSLYGVASELKCLEFFYNNYADYTIGQFQPGTYSVLKFSNNNLNLELIKENEYYFIPNLSNSVTNTSNISLLISNMLCSSVYKRCLTTERPIACLLSGGLDSSLIAALVNNYYNVNNFPNKLETYSIGLEGSEDLKNARIVSEYLGTNHTEILVTEEEMFDAIPEVIKAIESYDTTTIRASIGNYLLGKYISKNSEAKVIFNGDGADELFGGYLYMNKCPNDLEFDKETRRLLKDIYLFDVLRSDKCISSHGLEPRTPFLDKGFVNIILSISPNIRNHTNKPVATERIEKYLLRNSFCYDNFKDNKGRQLLPDKILWRKKEAFSDGVSSEGRSLYTILQEKIALKLNEKQLVHYETSIDTEKYYYKDLFVSFYPKCEHILPYYWMPKYIKSIDPSARTLSIYN